MLAFFQPEVRPFLVLYFSTSGLSKTLFSTFPVLNRGETVVASKPYFRFIQKSPNWINKGSGACDCFQSTFRRRSRSERDRSEKIHWSTYFTVEKKKILRNFRKKKISICAYFETENCQDQMLEIEFYCCKSEMKSEKRSIYVRVHILSAEKLHLKCRRFAFRVREM